MNIENLCLKEVELEKDFNYKNLYNDSTRGAVYKEEHKTVLREAISKGVINVKKFIVAEEVQEELYQIANKSRGTKRTLLESLKEYHNESSYVIAPLIYLLNLIDSNFSVVEGECLKIQSNVTEFSIRPRIDGSNARPRIFYPGRKLL